MSNAAQGSGKSSPSSATSVTKNSDHAIIHLASATPTTQVQVKPGYNSHQPIHFSISSSTPSPDRVEADAAYSPVKNAENNEGFSMGSQGMTLNTAQHFPPLPCHNNVSVTYEKQPLKEQPQNHQVISVIVSKPTSQMSDQQSTGNCDDSNTDIVNGSVSEPGPGQNLSSHGPHVSRSTIFSPPDTEVAQQSSNAATKQGGMPGNNSKSTQEVEEVKRQHEHATNQVFVSSALRSDVQATTSHDHIGRRTGIVSSKANAIFENPQLPPTSKSSPSYGSRMAAVRSTAPTTEEASSGVKRSTSLNRTADENRTLSIPPEIRAPVPGNQTAVSALRNQKNMPGKAKLFDEIREQVWMHESVAKVRPPSVGSRARPLICQDITNSNADTVSISHLPRGITYDRVQNLIEPFGEVEKLDWSPMEPSTCTVTYCDPMAAREARDVLNDAFVPGDAEKAMKAELRCRDSGAQLFVGDLTPDVTEEMLSSTFSKIAGESVRAELKRDLDSGSPIGYGFLAFQSESAAEKALVAGHRAKIGNACVRVGRAERNTYLYISELSGTVDIGDVRTLFGKFGPLVEEDTQVIRRSYAFVRFKNREDAEKAKRTLDKTDLKGRISVRYAEAEPLKACVAVQFHSSVPRPPTSLRDLLLATFGKYGNCSVEIPRFHNGMWRKVAFVTFHGEPFASSIAALEAVQSVRFVSSLPVCCQFARELIPRLPSKGLISESMAGRDDADCGNGTVMGGSTARNYQERLMSRGFSAGRNLGSRNGNQSGLLGSENQKGDPSCHLNGQNQQFGNTQPTNAVVSGINDAVRTEGSTGIAYGTHGINEFVPVYVPISALQQHPSSGAIPGTAGAANVGLGMTGINMTGPDSGGNVDFSAGYHAWANRMAMGNNGSVGAPGTLNHAVPALNSSFTSFTPAMQDRSRW